ncbi:hypothetical protein A5320_18040 [Rheinheimera sp. SA_1]|nr:hypothetical protein A5320_18040 [Rheinheimera sp. SA_1]
MVVTNGERINWLQRFERHKVLYSYLALALYILLNNTINATSVWMEHNRQPGNMLPLWEPFLWEYSSMLATLLLAPLLVWWFDRHPLRLTQLRALLLAHLLGSLLFSLAHTGLMVGCRELVYGLLGRGYDFGPWLRELFYEYRKDAWGYLFLLGLYQLLQFVYHRLTGDATLISGDDEPGVKAGQNTENEAVTAAVPLQPNSPQHFLVKKLDREFLVAISDIEWLEACGNYVNLHCKGRIYPLRATLSQTMLQLELQGFSRIHRSFAVNHRHIDNISYQPSGDGELVLKNGQQLALSRRFKEQFRTRFQAAG